MSQSMLTVSGGTQGQKNAQVHLLPCRIHHDGNVDPVNPYWSPRESTDGVRTAYFRGRKLYGKTIKLPEGYYGSLVEKGETKAEVRRIGEMYQNADVQEMPEAIETAPLNSKAHFDSFVVWCHESTAESIGDPYVRSMEEWVSFAGQIHSYSSQD